MGFDISYHPIREDEMEVWFFAPMKALREGDDSLIQKVAEERSKQQEKFFAEKYKGAYIYQDVAIAQIKEATGMSEEEIAKKVQEGKFTSQKTYVELDDTEQE